MEKTMGNHMPHLIKEWVYVLLLLLEPRALCEQTLSLKIEDFNHSEAEVSCHFGTDLDMTNFFFDVYKENYKCLHSAKNSCNEIRGNNCDIDCLPPEDPKTLRFSIKLYGKCNAVVHVKCSVNSVHREKMINFEKSITLTDQTDPPIITVNDGRPVEASLEPVLITCAVKNMCHKNQLHISVNAPCQCLNTTHATDGSRFTTTLTHSAIFVDPGNYTIFCKEAGKDDQYSRSTTLVVNPGKKVEGLKAGEKPLENGGPSMVIVAFFCVPVIIIVTSVIIYRTATRRFNHGKSARMMSMYPATQGIPVQQEKEKKKLKDQHPNAKEDTNKTQNDCVPKFARNCQEIEDYQVLQKEEERIE